MNNMSVNPVRAQNISFQRGMEPQKLTDDRGYVNMVDDLLKGGEPTNSQISRIAEQNKALATLIERWNLGQQIAAIRNNISKERGEPVSTIGFNQLA
jgi:hypothetical protein